MEQEVRQDVMILWNYMHMNMPLRKADFIVGFGCYNEEIPLRAAELYREGWAPRVLFSGGLGRHTKQMWDRSEAERFADIAIGAGVPAEKILLESRSTNTGENIAFTRKLLEPLGVRRIIGVHKPFMERRVAAAMGVYWPGMDFVITSPQISLDEYIALSSERGFGEKRVIEILTGDFQRLEVYADRGFQLRQDIPAEAWAAFHRLVDRGYTFDLVQ